MHRTTRPFAATVSQLKTYDFSNENSKGFEVLQFNHEYNDETTALQRRDCKLRNYTLPVKTTVNLQKFLSTPVTQKCQNFDL